MHDTLEYMAHEPVHRKYHHGEITFGLLYAFSENFVLPLSHDEVVHGKGTLLTKMSGDDWQKFANLRAYYGFMWGYPGKKLLFMGQEFAQRREWSEARALDWHLLDIRAHRGMRQLVRDLNHLYRSRPALHAPRLRAGGLLLADRRRQREFGVSPGCARRRAAADRRHLQLHAGAARQLPRAAAGGREWREIINTDAADYGGSGKGNGGRGRGAAPMAGGASGDDAAAAAGDDHARIRS